MSNLLYELYTTRLNLYKYSNLNSEKLRKEIEKIEFKIL